MKLVIVESPTKAKTIAQFLGKGYEVQSSFGHVRDLPKSKLGIDIQNNFEPQYVTPRRVQSTVTKLKKSAAKAERLILATDEDREGEAIAFHLAHLLNSRRESTAVERGGKNQEAKIERIVFHEITRDAIHEALQNPRDIDMNLVQAQQARRVLDRLVGYQLSPFLWRKVAGGLSAGRVQSVALRLIAEREEEIKHFTPEEYWTIVFLFGGEKEKEFEAFLSHINGEMVPKLGIKKESEAQKIVGDLKRCDFRVLRLEKKGVKKNPLAPFTTSTLQQESTKRLGFSAKKTMFLAQNLYESGAITYMRTDSVNLSREALERAAAWIKENLDERYHRSTPRTFKSKSRLSQEAHEAIRPTDVSREPSKTKLAKDQMRVYDLVWRRFIASQLPEALFNATHVEVEARGSRIKNFYTLSANGNVLAFDGFLKFWPMKFEEKELPALRGDEKLTVKEITPQEHWTEPPPRYNEASLIKTLEKYGVGRPSTYVPTISVIQERGYVEKNQGRFYPTEIGTLVNKVVVENFPEVVDIGFTAKMEEELDQIAEGKEEWRKVIKDFYDPFSKNLEEKYQEVSKKELTEEKTDLVCEKCGKPMVVKLGRFGKFLACSGYPECRNTKTLKETPKEIGLKCPTCGEGEVVERRVSRNGRARGKIFWGCSRYPQCDYSSWVNPLSKDGEKLQGK